MEPPVSRSPAFEAAGLEAAIELAARIPAARLGGAIETRPIEEC